MRLKDKAVIIIGGGAGFGEATAKRFAEEGVFMGFKHYKNLVRIQDAKINT